MEKSDITFFDPNADWTVVERGLPHWSQAGCVCFVTWRLNDSLPLEALEQVEREIAILLRKKVSIQMETGNSISLSSPRSEEVKYSGSSFGLAIGSWTKDLVNAI